MAYEIQALIAKAGAFGNAAASGLIVVPLLQAVELVPIGKMARERFSIPLLPLTDEGLESVPASLDRLCKQLSSTAKVAYIEAELFGGAGTQAFALYENGNLVEGPITDSSAINQALNALGVESNIPETDEFDFVGLGKCRSTDKWA